MIGRTLITTLIFAAVVATSIQRVDAQFFAQPKQDIVSMYLFNGQDEASFKRQLERKVGLRVLRAKGIAKLNESQVTKINFAIKGDLSRFYREMDLVREKTKHLDINKQNEMQEAWTLVAPLYEKVMQTGVIGDDSLFERVLETTLDEQQAKNYADYLQFRSRAKIEAIVRMSLAELEQSIPLLARQRKEFIALLMKQKFPRIEQRGMEAYVGAQVIAKLKKDDLSSILDEQQLAAFEKFRKRNGVQIGGLGW